MSEIRTILRDMREQRWSDDQTLVHVDEEQMNLPTAFTVESMLTGRPGVTGDVEARFLYLRRADHIDEHRIQIERDLLHAHGQTPTEVHRFWALNQAVRADLHAALCGLTDDDLDETPVEPEGEWSLRQILEHLIMAERLYSARAKRALHCWRAGEPYSGHLRPVDVVRSFPEASLPDLIGEFDRARMESLDALLTIDDDELAAPLLWAGVDIDLRFQLMRYAQHEREHTAHIRKWRAQCGKPFSEAARLLGLCWQAHGLLEGALTGVPDDLLDRQPDGDEWSIRTILTHIARSEKFFNGMILGAVE